jgi:hypothetical protein
MHGNLWTRRDHRVWTRQSVHRRVPGRRQYTKRSSAPVLLWPGYHRIEYLLPALYTLDMLERLPLHRSHRHDRRPAAPVLTVPPRRQGVTDHLLKRHQAR